MIRTDLTVIQQRVLDCVPALHLPPHAHVLDAPCGRLAALTRELQKSEFLAVGADVDRDAAARLGSSFVEANLDAPLPWRDETFDAVFSTEGIEHLENQFAFLRELHRVLKPGGALVLTTPNITALRSRMRFFASGFFGRDSRPMNESSRHPLHHIGLLTFSELRYALHTSGFQVAAISHTHIKPVSYLYAVFVPWMWVYTAIAFRKEKDPAQRERNREIRSALYSRSMLFGECLMVTARKSVSQLDEK